MKWGKDQEERAAVVQKTHDTYALVRRLEEQIRGLDERLRGAEDMIGTLQHAIDSLSEPKSRRKAA